MLKVTKFGGSSLCDSAGFSRVREIVLADPARRVVVVSAAGRRHAADHKITDLLYLCHAHLQYGVSCWDLWRRDADRYREIRDGCCLTLPIEAELDAIYAAMRRDTPQDWIVSRGEYLSARLMADLLGFEFVDAKDWLLFDAAGVSGRPRPMPRSARLPTGGRSSRRAFTARCRTARSIRSRRGGSDVTGALAAAALHADLYENWTDVAGVLAADPRLIQNPAPVGQLRYEELQTLSRVGMQILHEDAVAPVRQAQIPLRICNAFEPEKPGTLVRPQVEPDGGQIVLRGPQEACHAAPELPAGAGRGDKAGRCSGAGAAFAVFHAERVRRAHGACADGARLRTAAPSAGAGRAGASPAGVHAARKFERSGRTLPLDRCCAGAAPRGRDERRAGPSAAKMRRLRPPARQRQPI